MNKTNTYTKDKGFAHLILLLGIVVVIAVGIVYIIFQDPQSDLRQSISSLVNKNTVSVTPTPSSLEDELETVPDTDPEEDFAVVDVDIEAL
jgi:hypothetical protein